MAYDFPGPPLTIGQIANGYMWDGEKWTSLGGDAGDHLPLTGGTLTGDLQIAGADPVLSLSKSVPTSSNDIYGTEGSIPRWLMRLGEGSNSDFKLYGYSNDGLSIASSPISIDRLTGHVALAGDPTSGLHAVTKQYADQSSGVGTFNVKKFGAIGNGVADDTLAIQNAINAAGPTNAIVFFPAGKYCVSGLNIAPTYDAATDQAINNPALMGESGRASWIVRLPGSSSHLLTIWYLNVIGTAYRAAQTRITNMCFFGHDPSNPSGTTGSSIVCVDGTPVGDPDKDYGYAPWLEDVFFDGSPQFGIYLGRFRNFGFFHRVVSVFTKSCAVFLEGNGDHCFVQCTFGSPTNVAADVAIFNGVFSTKLFGCDFHGGGSASNASGVAVLGKLSYMGFYECVFNSCGQSGVRVLGDNTNDDMPVQLFGCMFADNGVHAYNTYPNILISNRINVSIIGCKFLAKGTNSVSYHVGTNGVTGSVMFTGNTVMTGSFATGISNNVGALRGGGSGNIYVGGVNDSVGLPILVNGTPVARFEPNTLRIMGPLFVVHPTDIIDRWGGGTIIISANAHKPVGGPWLSLTADLMALNVMADYDKGLAEIAQLSPKRYTFKANDTDEKLSMSPHAKFAKDGKQFVGLIAQDVEAVMPDMVVKVPRYIDGIREREHKTLDTGELVYALINAVKELKARLEKLEGP